MILQILSNPCSSLFLKGLSVFSPIFLPLKWHKIQLIMFLNWEERLLYFCRILLSGQAGSCGHGDRTFLCQWVSATSSSTCPKPPFLARHDICRHSDIWSWKTWVLELHSRHGHNLLLRRHLARQDFVATATCFGQTGQRTCNSRQAGNVVPGRNDSCRPKFAGCSSFCFSFIGSYLVHSFPAQLG